MTRFGKVFTFSNVVACLALFVALGGSVYAAGKISGKQIKRSSLPGNRIKPKTVRANRIEPKTLTGRQVKPKSLTGAQIDQQTLTEVSAASLANVHYQATTIEVPPGWPDTRATADCPQGMSVIGGGAMMSKEEGSVVGSAPTPLHSGWTAIGHAWFSDTTMTVTAICVPVQKLGGAAQSLPAPPRDHGPNYQSLP